jgi:uncharacterized protein YfaS (alpha-2-macroglobulin family)
MSDAVRRTVRVLPYGREVASAESGRLDGIVRKAVHIPNEAITGTGRIFVKIHPGYFSQVVEGLDQILRMPFGCFEQTTSITYPNVLVLNYLKETHQITPEIQMRAERYIGLGYQRLLTFETSVPGGFDWYGRDPPKLLLTAYGLMEFTDMAEVYPVDPDVIHRTQNWLATQQNSDGSWEPADYLRFTRRIADSMLTSTAQVLWSLIHSGYRGPEIARGIRYLRNNLTLNEDSHTLALVANALAAYDEDDPLTRVVLEELDERKVEENNWIHWTSPAAYRGYGTFTGSSGEMKDTETTALVAIAYLTTGFGEPGKILEYLISVKDAWGTWGSTQTTVLSMKALVLAARTQLTGVNGTVRIVANEMEAAEIAITPQTSDVLQVVYLGEYTHSGVNEIEMEFDGEGTVYYQLVTRYHVPWSEAPTTSAGPISISVSYDRRSLSKNDIVRVETTVSYSGDDVLPMVIVDLGIPSGFEVLRDDIDAMVSSGVIAKYDLTPRQIILYLDGLAPDSPLELSHRLRAKFPIRAKTPSSEAYAYYNPEIHGVAAPVELEVID